MMLATIIHSSYKHGKTYSHATRMIKSIKIIRTIQFSPNVSKRVEVEDTSKLCQMIFMKNRQAKVEVVFSWNEFQFDL
jgi:dUTPase